MSSPGTSTADTLFVHGLQAGDGDGVHGIGGGSGRGGVFTHGPTGKVGLRVEGDLEVTGDMPHTVHVSKCEVAPTECRCIVQVAEPAERPWLPKDYFNVGVMVGVFAMAVVAIGFQKWMKSW